MQNVSYPSSDWERSGKTIQTVGAEYLGVAKNKELALLFSESLNLLKLCKRVAEGEPVPIEEFVKIVEKLQ